MKNTNRRIFPVLSTMAILVSGSLLFATPSSAENGAYEAKVILETTTDVFSKNIVYPEGQARITSEIITLTPGAVGKLHRHTAPMYAYILEGEITVDYGENGQRTYRKGDAIVEAQQIIHHGTNPTDTPVHLLVVYMGAEDSADVTLP